jgi:hypothetical protein
MTATFEFIPETHTYLLDGRVIPSVTQCLDACGIVDYSHVPQPILDHKAEVGTAAHAACWYHDEGDLNIETIDPEISGYLVGWQKFRNETGFTPRLIERRGIHATNGMQYGYTLDREGELYGRDTLIEIKCTASVEPSWGPQTAAYEIALRAIDGKTRQRVAVHLRPAGSYGLVALRDVNDYQVFSWALGLETWKRQKGKNNGNNGNHHS